MELSKTDISFPSAFSETPGIFAVPGVYYSLERGVSHNHRYSGRPLPLSCPHDDKECIIARPGRAEAISLPQAVDRFVASLLAMTVESVIFMDLAPWREIFYGVIMQLNKVM